MRYGEVARSARIPPAADRRPAVSNEDWKGFSARPDLRGNGLRNAARREGGVARERRDLALYPDRVMCTREQLLNQKARDLKIENPAKIHASYRKIDLYSSVAAFLKKFIGDRKTGLLFASRNGKPLSQSNMVKRHLHPALLKLGFVNATTGTHKAGNHAFRRYLNTCLRNRANCPDGLYKYWMAGANESMSDLYDKIRRMTNLVLSGLKSAGSALNCPQLYRKLTKIRSCLQLLNCFTFSEKGWSGREDLNLRPPGPEPGALPG